MRIEISAKDAKKIESIVDQTTARFLEELPNLIFKKLEAAVARSLGFSDSWGKWEVDHCNGRTGMVGEYVSQQALDKAKGLTQSIKWEPSNEFLTAAKKEYAEKLASSLKEELEKRAEIKAKELSEKIASGTLELEVINLSPKSKAYANPSYGSKHIDQYVLRDLLKKDLNLDPKR